MAPEVKEHLSSRLRDLREGRQEETSSVEAPCAPSSGGSDASPFLGRTVTVLLHHRERRVMTTVLLRDCPCSLLPAKGLSHLLTGKGGGGSHQLPQVSVSSSQRRPCLERPYTPITRLPSVSIHRVFYYV